jgi:serine/threonine protein kinase
MPYSAPETYSSDCTFNEKNDIFSFGVMAYEILFNKFPFFVYKDSDRSKVFRENIYTNRWFYSF